MSPEPAAGPAEPVLGPAAGPPRPPRRAERPRAHRPARHRPAARIPPTARARTTSRGRSRWTCCTPPSSAGRRSRARRGTRLRYLDEAVDEDSGRFRNFRGVDGEWLEAIGSEDSHGRAVLALGRAMSAAPDRAFRTDAAGIFRRALPGTVGLTFLHARASALIGCAMAASTDQTIGSRAAWTAVGARLAGTLADDFAPVAPSATLAVAGRRASPTNWP